MNGDIIRRQRSVGGLVFCLAAAALIGFVSGRPLAEAAGAVTLRADGEPLSHLRSDEGSWVFASMFLVALFTFGLLRLLLRLGQHTVAVLGQVQARPSLGIAVLLIGSGVLCLLAAVALQWNAAGSGTGMTVSAPAPVSLPPGFPRVQVSAGTIGLQTRTSLMVPVTTILVLLAGTILIALGIWSGIPARPVRPAAIPSDHVSPVSATAFSSEKGP